MSHEGAVCFIRSLCVICQKRKNDCEELCDAKDLQHIRDVAQQKNDVIYNRICQLNHNGKIAVQNTLKTIKLNFQRWKNHMGNCNEKPDYLTYLCDK